MMVLDKYVIFCHFSLADFWITSAPGLETLPLPGGVFYFQHSRPHYAAGLTMRDAM